MHNVRLDRDPPSVSAFDAETGEGRWHVALDSRGGVYFAAAMAGGVFVGDAGGLLALDGATGDQRWYFRPTAAGGLAVTDRPTVVDGAVYVGSHDWALHALDLATGAERWRFEVGDTVGCTPTVVGRTVYIISQDGNA